MYVLGGETGAPNGDSVKQPNGDSVKQPNGDSVKQPNVDSVKQHFGIHALTCKVSVYITKHEVSHWELKVRPDYVWIGYSYSLGNTNFFPVGEAF